MNDDPLHVGFVGGLEVASNVRTLLENLRRLLERRQRSFRCDLLIGPDVTPPSGYRPVRVDGPPVTTARGQISTLYRGIRAYATQERPDVLVQLTRFPTHGTATAVAGRRSGTPTVTRLAGDNFREYKFSRGLGNRARTFALKNVIAQSAVHLPEAVIVLGPNGRSDLARRLRRRNVWTIPQPVDQEKFSPVGATERERIREDLGLPPIGEQRILLTVGRVSRRKGAGTIRSVADGLPQDVTWYVVGDGPLRSELGDLERVRPVGRVPHDRIAGYYRAADCYVHPSLHDGLPNVLLEAAACGTPSISRDVGECETVATVTFDEVSELPELIDRSYDRVTLDDRFDEDRLAARYENLLCEVAR